MKFHFAISLLYHFLAILVTYSGKCFMDNSKQNVCILYVQYLYQKQILIHRNFYFCQWDLICKLDLLKFKYWRDLKAALYRSKTGLCYVSKEWKWGYSAQIFPRNILSPRATVLAQSNA